jgi:hypothetical protein
MRRFAALALLLATFSVCAQTELEVLPLRNRAAEAVIPVLRPLREPGGVIAGQCYQLGGVAASAAERERGGLSAREVRSGTAGPVWIKVKEVPN